MATNKKIELFKTFHTANDNSVLFPNRRLFVQNGIVITYVILLRKEREKTIRIRRLAFN